MQSSYRIIKNQNLSEDSLKETPIETKFLIETREDMTYKDEGKGKDPGELLGQEEGISREEVYRDIMMEIEEEKLQILAMAQKQAEAMKIEAEKKGHKEGYQAGYEEARAEAKGEADQIRGQALDLIKNAKVQVDQYFIDKKGDLIALAADMAEAMVYHTIDMSNDGILMLIKPILERYAKGETIVIRCHPSKIPSLKFKATELEALYQGTKIVILEDPSLEEYGATIETEEQFIDLQIKKQLDAMVNEINNLE